MSTLAASTSRSGVIVLNTDNTTLHTVSVQHAIRMLVREVAIVEEAQEGRKIGPYPWPIVLRLIRYVKTTFLYAQSPAWSKRGVLRRDHHRCAYCRARPRPSTICCRSLAAVPTPG